ncbi:TPA: hypothetical protein GRR52_24540 [Vibrio parahaemolyticus]|nr:hypothetical protein [Vibrio parahaemolyticus]
MSNIEIFENHAAKILATLYANFPVKITLQRHDIATSELIDPSGNVVKSPEDEDEEWTYYDLVYGSKQSEDFQLESEIFNSTIVWLKQEGFLTYEHNGSHHHFGGVQLTLRGLEVLKSVPSAIDGEGTLGDRLKTELENSSFDMARDMVKVAITQAATLFG